MISTGVLRQLIAAKEIVLSAGSVGTPHILLNSGIGNSKDLTAIGVTPLVDLPDVGANLSDHPIIGNSFLVSGNLTFETYRRDSSLGQAALQQWETSKTGPYTDTILDHVGFIRVPAASVPTPDTAAGPNSPHFEMITSVCVIFSSWAQSLMDHHRRMVFLLSRLPRATSLLSQPFLYRPHLAVRSNWPPTILSTPHSLIPVSLTAIQTNS